MSRVAFFVPSDNNHSGINKVVENLVRALISEEKYECCDLLYLVSGKKCVEDEIAQGNKSNDLVKVDNYLTKTKSARIFLGCNSNRKCYYNAIKTIRCVVKVQKYDTVIFSGMEWALSFYFALRNSDVHVFAWEHRNFSAGPKFRLEWIGKRLAVRKFEGIINITKKDNEMYCKHFPAMYHHKFHQIYNVVKVLHSRVEYAVNSKRIISCGYLSPIKGFDMLIYVAAEVFSKHPDWSWDIYGEGDERTNLEKMIVEKNLSNHVRLKGFVSNINDLYTDYSFFVMTSRKEGMPGVLIEAQHAGLPYVSFDILTGPSETVIDGVNGYLIKPFDVQKMTERINSLIENQEERIRFSANSMMKHGELKKEFIIDRWNDLLTKM